MPGFSLRLCVSPFGCLSDSRSLALSVSDHLPSVFLLPHNRSPLPVWHQSSVIADFQEIHVILQLTTLYGSTPIWKKCKFLRPYVSPLGVSHPLPLSPGSLPLQPCTLSMPSSGHLRAFVLAAPSEGNSLHSSHGYILTSPPGDPSN